jgi:hypothetical protein
LGQAVKRLSQVRGGYGFRIAKPERTGYRMGILLQASVTPSANKRERYMHENIIILCGQWFSQPFAFSDYRGSFLGNIFRVYYRGQLFVFAEDSYRNGGIIPALRA